jgi:uncharacterized protein YaaW (UPF0174 family)
MAYREDSDLVFLKYCDDDDLAILVEFLTKTKGGRERYTEELLSNEIFKNRKNYQGVWELIAGELQCFGADSIVTFFRWGKGVLYREILMDVCGKLKVNYNKKSSIEQIENNLLLKIVEDSLEKMTEEEKREFAMQMNLNVANLSAASIMAVLQVAVRVGGFASYQMAVIIANTVARVVAQRGLTLAGNQMLARGLAVLAGPIGWVITAILTFPIITGTAYRITIPSVIQVAYMRRKLLAKKEDLI